MLLIDDKQGVYEVPVYFNVCMYMNKMPLLHIGKMFSSGRGSFLVFSDGTVCFRGGRMLWEVRRLHV